METDTGNPYVEMYPILREALQRVALAATLQEAQAAAHFVIRRDEEWRHSEED